MKNEKSIYLRDPDQVSDPALSQPLEPAKIYRMIYRVEHTYWIHILGAPTKQEIEEEAARSFREGAGDNYGLDLLSVKYDMDSQQLELYFKTPPDFDSQGISPAFGVGGIVLTIGLLASLIASIFVFKQIRLILVEMRRITKEAPGSLMWIALPVVIISLGVTVWKKPPGLK